MAAVLPFVDALSTGRSPGPSHEYATQFNVNFECFDVSAEEILSQVKSYFSSAGRPIDDQSAIAYLIAIAQNFFVVFSGYPGVGSDIR